MKSLPTVLVIDDEIRSQEALRRTLEQEFNVLTVSSALEGCAVMERKVCKLYCATSTCRLQHPALEW